jgi:hypothetical protein
MSTISEQEYITRIRQLEGLNATLSAQVDRMRPVVEAALPLVEGVRRMPAWSTEEAALEFAMRMYQQQMAALTKGK